MNNNTPRKKSDTPTSNAATATTTTKTSSSTSTDLKSKYQINQQVELKIIAQTDLGFKALVNGEDQGLLYHNEVFQPLSVGQILPGYIRFIREDNKIDLILRPSGHKATVDIEANILAFLEQQGGYARITDKTDSATINDLFFTSKKKFKIALGALYKKRLIQIEDEGIRLNDKNKK